MSKKTIAVKHFALRGHVHSKVIKKYMRWVGNYAILYLIRLYFILRHEAQTKP